MQPTTSISQPAHPSGGPDTTHPSPNMFSSAHFYRLHDPFSLTDVLLQPQHLTQPPPPAAQHPFSPHHHHPKPPATLLKSSHFSPNSSSSQPARAPLTPPSLCPPPPKWHPGLAPSVRLPRCPSVELKLELRLPEHGFTTPACRPISRQETENWC